MTTADRSFAPVYVALTAAGVNIGVHASLTPDHLQEMRYVGVLFIIGNVCMFLAMLLLYDGRTSDVGWLLGSLTCAAEILAFVLSRTAGLPNGYHERWAAGGEDYLGLVSVAAEALFIAAAAVAVRVRVQLLRNAPRRRFG